MKRILEKIINLEAISGCLLILSSIFALILANSSWEHTYNSVLQSHINITVFNKPLSISFIHIINDGLMVLFFLTIGLEIKREMLEGQLSKTSQIVLPLIAAIGGIIVPALIYTGFNHNDDEAMKGWAVPTATDIAFALGILALLGSRIPNSLKLFIMAVAIYDDLAAIVIIAIFYTSHLSGLSLLCASIAILALWFCNKLNVKSLSVYLIIGFLLWLTVLHSGVHATLAGVFLGFAIPLKLPNTDYSPLKWLEKKLHSWVSYGILPLFAFANAGINLAGISLNDFTTPITLGILIGLFVGKQISIFAFSFIIIKLKYAILPKNCSWKQFYGSTILCGIGFTMSLFISSLAFEDDNQLIINSRLGIFLATILSAAIGYTLLRFSKSLN